METVLKCFSVDFIVFNIFGKSSEIFGNVRKSSENFRSSSEMFVFVRRS